MKTLLILGASGLVGQQLLAAALDDPSVARVVAPSRRPLPKHDRLLNPVVDYDTLPARAAWWRADAVICALGTTMSKAGSQQAFRKVDHDYVLAAASLARQAGTLACVVNSSSGANAASKSFYLRVKGEVEQDLAGLGFVSFTAVRPSLLDGGRRPEWRPGEALALWLARRLAPIIPARYRAVPTTAVAACMLSAGLAATPGRHVIESEAIPRSANRRTAEP